MQTYISAENKMIKESKESSSRKQRLKGMKKGMKITGIGEARYEAHSLRIIIVIHRSATFYPRKLQPIEANVLRISCCRRGRQLNKMNR